MSQDAGDIHSDEDCELVEEDMSSPSNTPEKKTRTKKVLAKSPRAPKSPYLCSLNVTSKRTPVKAWRLPRPSLGDTRGNISAEAASGHSTSYSNGPNALSDTSHMQKTELDTRPYAAKYSPSPRRFLHTSYAFNGLGGCDHGDKEDMYHEIIRLKKSLNAQKSDNQQMRAKLRRLEEDNVKREKQIKELLDPTKGTEFTRSLVDKKKEGSVILNGMKQRILRLEQQCREKENALSKLQSELRTTSLEELKITAETYFDEIQRLKILLEVGEKSSQAENKCSQRKQKALSSAVHRLSEDLKLLQHENESLKEELNLDSPGPGVKGYREWSKQRILRRMLELERKLEDGERNTPPSRSCSRLEQEVQTTLTGACGPAMATKPLVSVGTTTEEWEEVSQLRERLACSQKMRAELEETLSNKECEVTKLKTEQEQAQKEAEQWKAEQEKLFDQEREQHKQELEELEMRILTLEADKDQLAQEPLYCASPTPACNSEEDEYKASQETEERDTEYEEKENEIDEGDVVIMQSALRAHLQRETQLRDLRKDVLSKDGREGSGDISASACVDHQDSVALTMIQAVFRGHLARCSSAIKSLGSAVTSTRETNLPTTASSTESVETAHIENPSTGDPDEQAQCDSDDSDDIIVSPSRPLRSREAFML